MLDNIQIHMSMCRINLLKFKLSQIPFRLVTLPLFNSAHFADECSFNTFKFIVVYVVCTRPILKFHLYVSLISASTFSVRPDGESSSTPIGSHVDEELSVEIWWSCQATVNAQLNTRVSDGIISLPLTVSLVIAARIDFVRGN